MPGFEDRLKERLHRLAEPAGQNDVFERVAKKRSKRRVVRRVESGLLAAVVLAGAGGGAYGLVRAFGSNGTPTNTAGTGPLNGRIAYMVGRDANAVIYSVEPDGTGVTKLLEGRDPSWSPDGAWIAFRTGIPQQSGEQTAINVARSDGTDARRIYTLPVEPGGAGAPAWSPDGSQIAFANIDGIYVIGSDGSDPHRVTQYEGSHACYDVDPTWSSNGTTIAFAVRCDGSEEGIWAVDADGSNRRQLLAPRSSIEALSYPEFSPDGTKIAFTGAPPPNNGNASIYVMNADGSDVTEVIESGWWSSALAWSPDGQELAFVRSDGGIYTMHSDGTGLHLVVSEGTAPAWQRVPAETVVVPPTPQPSVPPDEAVLKEIGPACDVSKQSGDFDGDGFADVALIYYPQPLSGSCDVAPGDRGWQLAVWWSSGATGRWDLPKCGTTGPSGDVTPTESCRAFAAPDLDGNGTDELAVEVSQSAWMSVLQFYALRPDERPKEPLELAPGGPQGVGPGQVQVLGWGGSAAYQERIECRRIQGTRPLVVAISSELDQQRHVWVVQEQPFEFDGSTFTLLNGSRYEIAADSPDVREIEAGADICGAPVVGETISGSP